MGFLMEGKWWEKDVVEAVQEWLKNTELLISLGLSGEQSQRADLEV